MSAKDIERLAEVAAHADGMFFVRNGPEGSENRAYAEIVRAILQALREPSEEMIDEIIGRPDYLGSARPHLHMQLRKHVQTYIDHLLAE